MVIQTLSSAPLLFLTVEGQAGPHSDIFDMLPWNNDRWRALAGLTRLPRKKKKDRKGREDDDDDDDDDDWGDDEDKDDESDNDRDELGEKDGMKSRQDIGDLTRAKFTPDQADRWLGVSKEGYDSLTQKKAFDRLGRMNAARVFSEVWMRSQKDHKTCVERIKHIPGHDDYRLRMLSMLNRPDGILDRVEAVMKQCLYTPIHRWRDVVEETPVSTDSPLADRRTLSSACTGYRPDEDKDPGLDRRWRSRWPTGRGTFWQRGCY